MSEQLNQKISQYLDGDLDRNDALHLLKEMQVDTRLQSKLQRYLIAQQAIRATPSIMAEQDFLSKVQQGLQSEPVYFLPKAKSKINTLKKSSLLAVAASLVALTVMVPVWMKSTFVNPNASMMLSQEKTTDVTERSEHVRMYPVNQRFQDYLQAHNGSLYTNGTTRNLAQAQLAGYDQE